MPTGRLATRPARQARRSTTGFSPPPQDRIRSSLRHEEGLEYPEAFENLIPAQWPSGALRGAQGRQVEQHTPGYRPSLCSQAGEQRSHYGRTPPFVELPQ